MTTNEPTQTQLVPGGRWRVGGGGEASAEELQQGWLVLSAGLCSSVSSAPWISSPFNGTTSPLIPACHSSAFTARALPCTSPQHNRLLSVLTHLPASPPLPRSLSSTRFNSVHLISILCKCASIVAYFIGDLCCQSNMFTK